MTNYVYDAANRLTNRTESTGQAYTYAWSDSSQMLAEYYQSNPIRTFTYDAAGQLSEATVLMLTTRFRYNGDGQRLSLEVVGGDITTYTLDYLKSNNILMETTAQTTTLYLYGHSCLGEWTATDGWKYYLASTLGQVRQAVDATGAIIYDWTFGPDRNVLTGVKGKFTHLECGVVYDWSTGLIYQLGRYFDPTTGVWLIGTGIVLAQAGTRGKRRSKRRLLLLLLLLLCIGGVLSACNPPPPDCNVPKLESLEALINPPVVLIDESGPRHQANEPYVRLGDHRAYQIGSSIIGKVDVPEGTDGELIAVQNVKASMSLTFENGYQTNSEFDWSLDESDPYPYKSVPDPCEPGTECAMYLGDSPGVTLSYAIRQADSPKGTPLTRLRIEESFRTYLLWSVTPEIRVALGRVDWDWHATAEASKNPDGTVKWVVVDHYPSVLTTIQGRAVPCDEVPTTSTRAQDIFGTDLPSDVGWLDLETGDWLPLPTPTPTPSN